MSYRIGFVTRTLAALLAAFGVPSTVPAATFIVGTGSGCTHATIQAAIEAAASSPGADTIRITRSLTYTAQAVSINTAQELTLEGGYATCAQGAPDTTKTVVSGSGGAAESVFRITAPTGAWIRLRRLEISGGDVATTGRGGGIRFSGDGILEISDSVIANNIAGYGGGIAAEGTGSNAELVLGTNVVVSGNTARYDGGGVLAQGIEMSMLHSGSWIYNNHAQGTSNTGYGGGLLVLATNRPSYAYVGTGTGVLGTILGNDARYGGGVAILGQGSEVAELQLFATDPAYQAYVGGNTASVLGGGLYLGTAQARARLWNAVLDNNEAPNGAAAWLAAAAGLYVNFGAMHPQAVGCTIGKDCGRISNNIANADADPGSIVHGETGAILQFGYLPASAPADARGGVVIRNNTAASIFGGAAGTQIYRSIIVDNTTSSDVIKLSGAPFHLVDSTIAGNAIGGGSAILRTTNIAVTIQRSILWQPGRTVLSRSGGSVTVERMVANENGGLGAGAAVFDPRFVDAARGDYGLRAGSRAVDYALAIPGNGRDAFGQPRNVDLFNPDQSSPRDVGALERQSLLPMVLNGDFDTDLRLWDVVTAGSTTRDTTQNANGAANSGSAHISRTGQSTGAETYGVSQCIHLPGPAVYALNGWGRGTGGPVTAGDQAILRWEYRRNGGENCTGTPDAWGSHALSSGAWNRPAQPALIDIAPANWGDSPSITVVLVAMEFGAGTASTNAWFDGVTLQLAQPEGQDFADGFEGCPPALGVACR